MRRAGIRLDVGVREAEAKQLNAAFFARVLHGRPYVTLKWAQSADGKVAGKLGQRMQISNELSMRVVHELRRGAMRYWWGSARCWRMIRCCCRGEWRKGGR